MQRKIENGFNERQTKKNKFDDSEFLKQGEEMKENVQMAATEDNDDVEMTDSDA
ncbi:11234_t:CDS:2 [Entrophospora sp. SA101]|nr:9146_t:CDS:2 [Entrophospora candida]CAJ0760120.1 11234_t:CDS:2 [Entrophospora sp. SA101]